MTSFRELFQRKATSPLQGHDARQKAALHTLEVSIKALMNALSERGVSDDGLLEFEVLMDRQEYKKALDVSTRYLMSLFDQDEEVVQLSVFAWQSLCNYHGRIFQQAYRKCLLREGVPPAKRHERDRRDELAEVVTACLVGLYKTQRLQDRLERQKKWEQWQEEQRQESEVADDYKMDKRDGVESYYVTYESMSTDHKSRDTEMHS